MNNIIKGLLNWSSAQYILVCNHKYKEQDLTFICIRHIWILLFIVFCPRILSKSASIVNGDFIVLSQYSNLTSFPFFKLHFFNNHFLVITFEAIVFLIFLQSYKTVNNSYKNDFFIVMGFLIAYKSIETIDKMIMWFTLIY